MSEWPSAGAASTKAGCHPAGSCLLVRAAELGEGDRETDERVSVAGSDRRGAFDDGPGDRVVAGGMTAAVDSCSRVGVMVQHGGLDPQGGVPGPPQADAHAHPHLRVVEVGAE